VARELGPSLEGVPLGSTVVIRCDIEPIVQVRQLLEASGWEVVERLFLPAERGFELRARKR
jgi:hypothetical protein